MRKSLNIMLLSFIFYAQPSHAWWLSAAHSAPLTTNEEVIVESTPESNKAHNDWLTSRFSEQHQQLIPVVAVADMFFSCNNTRKTDESDYELSFLINKMDRNTLAEKLITCLGEDTMQSDEAINFGLFGCFHAQLAHLPKKDREEKMVLVQQAVKSLSHSERQKSFSQCVTEQSIHYLK
ncbi:hypothetical protein CWS31_000855 [Colwellia echini]|uniref:Uncharacterized protein n=2 Tax=Colwellia echini TaxID=1982103 RepID=A0ABY3N218_9GAMM|nr:hypothetical protein CWS31_000855 [Colwellia echini]